MSAVEAETTEIPDESQPDETDTPPGELDESETEEPDEPEAPTDNDPSLEAVAAELRDRDKKIEKERSLHEKRLSALLGAEWDAHVMCPLCVGDGFLVPYGPGELPSEQIDAMDALSGRYTPPEYVEDSDYQQCDHCEGWGHTITGAQNPEHLTKLCDKCGGNGFIKKLYVPQIAPPPVLTGTGSTPNTGVAVTYGSPGPADQWGRPAGHVHYGIEPQFVTA